MFLFADQLEYDEPMQEKVQRMAQFLLLFYVVAWLRAPVAEDAPANDLNLYRAVPLLVLCIKEPEIGVKRVAASALSDICKHSEELTHVVVENGAISNFAALISSPDTKLKRQILSALSNIAKHTLALAELVVEAEIFPDVFSGLQDADDLIRRNTAGLIKEIVKHTPELAQLIVNAGGMASIVDYLGRSEGHVALPGVMALGFTAAHSQQLAMSVIVSRGVVQLAICLNEEKDDHIRGAAVWALGQIGRHTPEHAKAIAMANLFPKLLEVGFRRGRSAEDSLARLVQTVQDGWNRPKPRRGPEDGVTADRFVLLAFDFSRAYDTIDHRMLHLKLLKLLPRCLATWIFRFLRDRRARVEVNGAHSSERVFRAGLPQGSVLAPTIYTLWAADLIETLRNASDRTDVLMYADDTATLSAGATVELAVARAQKSADALARWARHWKMSIAGQKTQALLLTQRSRDERGVQLLVNGTQVTGGTSLHLLGVTFDRLLHFKDHCDSLRRKVRPRTAQLRRMTGRTWGLREAQLRTVANGYVWGALEYAAGAWLPAASPSHVQLVERELLAAARVVTGCPRSTPRDPLLAEAGIPSAWSTRKTLAARTLCRALALPEDDPLRRVAEADPPTRLRSTTGWRQLGRSALIEAGAEGVTVEPRLEVPLLPWTTCRPIAFNLDVGPGGRRASSNETRREAARQHLAALPAQATWIWSDGSADAGVRRGGGGAVIFTASGETLEAEVAAGGLCSSTRAELFALRAALERVRDEPSPAPLVACSDSRAALSLLSAGAAAQTTTIGAAIWRTLLDIAERRQVTLQWVPAHCGLAENERADALAKQAATLPQGAVPSDARSLTRAVHRTATRQWRENWPDSFFKTIFGSTLPLPIPGEDREAAISVHQLRAGHWGRSLQYLHRIGRHPSVACLQCPDKRCPAALCAVCREEADVPEHVLLRCPALAGARLRLTGSIYVDPSRLRDADLCYTSADSSDDLQDKARRTLKSVLQMCVYMPALDPLLHEAPPNILKYVVGQYSKKPYGSRGTRKHSGHEALGLDPSPLVCEEADMASARV
ncbi:Sperm-associated antigen 6 [Amphibalanus amphitrite]|uniref:Sperm-associated antigen 6 n=1 Tax=Amphibalanus amphitrite TaxID=1232801 RepID=A0A6A4UUQ2_AMPAM|nr:Sperm-associated antigen 6 [Amphibalanus amphitrite]